MEEEKIFVERPDGIKYYRRAKNNTVGYDKNINIRVSNDLILDIKEIADKKGVKYNALIREIIEDYINENKEV